MASHNTIRLTSANGNIWDVEGYLDDDDGDINDGSQDAFDDWGAIGVEVRAADDDTLFGSSDYLYGFDLRQRAGRTITSGNNVWVDGVAVWRTMYSPANVDWMRYLDCFYNDNGEAVVVTYLWGAVDGSLGSDGSTTVSATSSGDLAITAADAWALTIENSSFDPNGPATDPPVGYVLGTNAAMRRDPTSGDFTTPWGGNGDDDLTHRMQFQIPAYSERCVMVYLYRGLREESDFPNDSDDSSSGEVPAGSEIAKAKRTLINLLRSPNFSGISSYYRSRIVNWGTTTGG